MEKTSPPSLRISTVVPLFPKGSRLKHEASHLVLETELAPEDQPEEPITELDPQLGGQGRVPHVDKGMGLESGSRSKKGVKSE